MARLFPLRSEAPTQERAPRVVDLADEDADAVFGALSSTTARRIYTHLSDEPGTPSDVAESIDSSIQNVRYHLENLEDAGLIEVVDTWYSSRGNEMSVYATADGPLIVTSDRSRADKLREALSRFLGGLAVLLGATVYVQFGLERTLRTAASVTGWRSAGGLGTEQSGDASDELAAGDGGGDDDADGAGDGGGDAGSTESSDADDTQSSDDGSATSDDGSATSGEEADRTSSDESFEITTESEGAGDGSADVATEGADVLLETLPPGLLFFLGGLLVLVLVTAWWYHRRY